MEENTIKVGDMVQHRYLSTSREMFVAEINGDTVVTRYYTESRFYTNEFKMFELKVAESKGGGLPVGVLGRRN